MIICTLCNQKVKDIMEHWREEHPNEYEKYYDWPKDWSKKGDIDE